MKRLSIFLVAAFFIACQSNPKSVEEKINPDIIPAADGFNYAESDSMAISLADSVVLALGGKRALDTANYINFNFFGVRDLFWAKNEKLVKIKSKRTDLTVIASLEKDSGRVFMHGAEQTHPDSLSKYIEVAQAMWINDTYWLMFPFKLKDSGVTLKYKGFGKDAEGNASHLLQLTFQEVGDTPENKYLAYVNADNYYVTQWDFYRNATDTVPAIVSPWKNYQDYNGVMLSDDRGQYKIPFIEVFSSISEQEFQETYKTL